MSATGGKRTPDEAHWPSDGGRVSASLTKIAVLFGVVVVLIVLPLSALLWMTSVPGRSFEGPLPPLTSEHQSIAKTLRRHVRAVASVPHNVRHPAALEATATYIEDELTRLGYDVRRQEFEAPGSKSETSKL